MENPQKREKNTRKTPVNVFTNMIFQDYHGQKQTVNVGITNEISPGNNNNATQCFVAALLDCRTKKERGEILRRGAPTTQKL